MRKSIFGEVTLFVLIRAFGDWYSVLIFFVSFRVFTCFVGSVAFRWEVGVVVVDFVDGNDSELVVDIWG